MDTNDSQSSSDEDLINPNLNPTRDGVSGFDEWEYSMRREMQEIVPGLFLGPYAAAMKSKLDSIQQAGITHIICIRQSIEANFVRPNFPQHIRYLVLDIADSPTENIIRYFRETKEFIDDCLAQGGKVLVHGNGGLSRSAAVVIAYVMEKLNITYREALAFVRNRRFCISVNEGFLNQLAEYEYIYRAQYSINYGAAPLSQNTLKRKRMDNDYDNTSLDH